MPSIRKRHLCLPGLGLPGGSLAAIAALVVSASELLAISAAPQPPAPREVVIDSLPATSSAPAWRLDSVPSLVLGRPTRPDDILIGRLASVATTRSGHILLLERAGNLFVFDSSGRHVATWGGGENEPGQLSGADSLSVGAGDTVLVKSAGRYINYFTIADGFLSRVAVDYDSLLALFPASVPPARMTSDRVRVPNLVPGGSLLLRSPSVSAGADVRPSFLAGRDTAHFLWLTRLGARPIDLGRWADRGAITQRGEGNYTRTRSVDNFAASYFAAEPRGSRLCVGDGAAPSVTCYESDGTAMRLRWSQQMQPLSTAEMDAERASQLRMAQRATPNASTAYPMELAIAAANALEFPPYLPVFSDVHVDSDRQVWIKIDSRQPTRSADQVYSVFAASGQYVADVTVPYIGDRPIIQEILSDRVIATLDGNQVVVVLPLRKGTGSR